MGYLALGGDYFSLSEEGRASEYYAKAFQLRERTSEREKLAITAEYYSSVTGELDKAAQTYQEQIQTYPRDYRAHLDLGNVYGMQGQYENAKEAHKESLRLAPRYCCTLRQSFNRSAGITILRRSAAISSTGTDEKTG